MNKARNAYAMVGWGLGLLAVLLLASVSFAQNSDIDLNISLDSNPPVINGVSVTTTPSSAVVSWTTDKPADSQVEYGTSASYGSTTPINIALVTSHTMTLSSLLTGTLYHYRILSADSSGLIQTTSDSTFSTLGATNMAFTQPTQGSVIFTSNVNVQYSVSGNLAGADHVHLKMDSDPEVMDLDFDGSYVFTSVPYGNHILTGYVARADHSKMPGSDASVSFGSTPQPTPQVTSFTASPLNINVGSSATLSWTVTNATTVSINQGIGSVAPSGSRTVNPATTTTYTLTATNGAGTTTAAVTITVNQPATPPIVTFTGSPATITAGQISTLSWNVVNATSISIDQGIGAVAASGTKIVSPSVTTTYTLTATNAIGTTTRTFTVTVNQIPPTGTFTVSPSTITSGQSATLTWTTSDTTSVSIDNGIGSVATSGTRSVSPATTTTYTLTGSGPGGTITRTATLTVVPLPPTATFSGNPLTITSGQSSTLTWSTTGAASVSIDNGIGTVAASGTVSVSPTSTTTYILTANNPGGTVTRSITITVNQPPPTATFSSNPATITVGQSSTLTWSTTGTTSVSIDNGIGTVAASGTRSVSPTTTTTYTLTATGPGGTVTQTASVTVNPLPPTIAFSVSPGSIIVGQSATLSWTSTGATSVSIDNSIGPVSLSGTATVSPSVTTTYTITASNPGGFTTKQVTLNVNPLPPPSAPNVTISLSPSSIVRGQSSTLSWTVAGATSVSIDNGIGTVAASGTLSVNPAATTTYTLTASNAGGTTIGSATLTVTVPAPTATLSASPVTITNGQSSTLSWTTADATTISLDQGIGVVAASGTRSVSPTNTTTYTLTASNSAGLVTRTAIVTVSAPQPVITFTADNSSINLGRSAVLTWSVANSDNVSIDNGIGTVASSGTVSVSPTNTTTYTLTATGPGGTATKAITITINGAVPTSTLTVTPSSIQVGKSAILSWTTTDATLVMLDGVQVATSGSMNVTPNANKTYLLSASGPGGTVNKTTTLTVTPLQQLPGDTEPPKVSISPASGTVYGVVEITITATDNAGVSFVEIYKDGVFLVDSATPPYKFRWNTTSDKNGPHTIKAMAKDTSGNSANATVMLVVDNLPPIPAEVTITSLTSGSATVIWKTDKPSTSRIEFGTTTSYGSKTWEDTSLTTSHSMEIAGLKPQTTYHFRVLSTGSQGLVYPSADYIFTTLGTGDTRINVTVPLDSLTVKGRITPGTYTKIDVPKNFAFRQIALLGQYAEDIEIIISRIEKPNLPDPPGHVYSYIKVDYDNKSTMSGIEVDFEVEKLWLERYNYNLSQIKLLRFSDGWKDMSTRYLSADDFNYKFRATLPGFSVFAIIADNGNPGTPPASLDSFLEPLISLKSQFPVNVQYFIISGAMFAVAVVLLLLHHRNRPKQTKQDTPFSLAERNYAADEEAEIEHIHKLIYSPEEEEKKKKKPQPQDQSQDSS